MTIGYNPRFGTTGAADALTNCGGDIQAAALALATPVGREAAPGQAPERGLPGARQLEQLMLEQLEPLLPSSRGSLRGAAARAQAEGASVR